MAGLQTHCNPCHNPQLASKNKLAEGAPKALIDNKSIFASTSILTASHAPISALASILILSENTYTDVDLQKVIKLALDLFIQDQVHVQESAKP